MNNRESEWGRKYYPANAFLMDSASFYIASRKLLVSNTMHAVVPGLVCAAYAIEQLAKAGLVYSNKQFPNRGSKGHDLKHLVSLLNKELHDKYSKELEFFTNSFGARYYDYEKRPPSMANSYFKDLDNIYFSMYEQLQVPLEYHCRLGIVALFLNEPIPSANDIKDFELLNDHYRFYLDLANKSKEAAGL